MMGPEGLPGDEHIWALGFPVWREVTGCLSVADLHRPNERCGIYVLGFANGERYVGKAVNVVRRFTDHRKTHDDVTHMTFKMVPQADQSAVEQHCIRTLERHGLRLRNIVHMSVVEGESDLDLVVTPEEQTRWLAGDLEGLEDAAQHVQDAALKQRYRRKFERFMALPFAPDALFVLGVYLQAVVPFPRRTELGFWMVSCLPSGAPEGSTLYLRVSLNMQEVFSLLADDQGLWASFHLARTPFQENLGEGWLEELQVLGWETTEHGYGPGGQDQFQVYANGLQEIIALLLEPASSNAMRLLNHRLMKKGPTYYSGFHCLDLVDAAMQAFENRQDELTFRGEPT